MKTKDTIEHYIYRYLSEDGSVFYVGKTDSSLKQRIDAHAKENKFLPYLENCKIEFISLDNKIETDILEKYYINSYQPILNEKDKENISLGLKLIKYNWTPYEVYIEKKKKEQELRFLEEQKYAKQNQDFFDAAYNAFLTNTKTFSTTFLHPNGMLPYQDTYIQVTTPNVKKCLNSYIQELNSENLYIFEYPNQIQEKIWYPVSKYKENLNMEYPNILESFLNELLNFKENDCYDEIFGYYYFFINEEYVQSSIYNLFKDFFYINFSDLKKGYIEINPKGYENIENIKEEIAKIKLQIYKENDIFVYLDDFSYDFMI